MRSKTEFKPHEKFEHYLIVFLAIGAAIVLIYLALLGPLFLDKINYKTSQSAKYQTIGQDLVNLIVLVPLLLIGALLQMLHREDAKHFLVLSPIYMIYMALSYGIGMEWSDNRYQGNSQNYFWCYLYLIIAALIMLMYIPSKFVSEDAPEYTNRQLFVYIPLVGIFLLIFAKMWIDEVIQVIQQGDTASGSYSAAPTIFWVIRYFDLGFTIPLGFISLYLLATRPTTGYPYLLLFFGFFVTMILAVNAMAAVMWYNNDPELQSGDIYIFCILAILSFAGYLFLIKDKIKNIIH